MSWHRRLHAWGAADNTNNRFFLWAIDCFRGDRLSFQSATSNRRRLDRVGRWIGGGTPGSTYAGLEISISGPIGYFRILMQNGRFLANDADRVLCKVEIQFL